MGSSWSSHRISNVSLDAVGLIAIAELTTVANRTALKGTAYLADILVLVPGIHRQQDATTVNGGEYPITANITSGYVFRVENQATVAYLHRVGETGHLTTVLVSEEKHASSLRPFIDLSGSPLAAGLYLLTIGFTITAIVLLVLLRDWWALSILVILMIARLLNVVLIRRRCEAQWHGAREPGVVGDLIILLSQDRWIRMRGLTDDLKAVTSGRWLRETTFVEGLGVGIATVMVYIAAALAANATQIGQIIFVVLLLANVGLLTFSNELLNCMQMKGRTLRRIGKPVQYTRRLDMANELVAESGRRDWAIKMGMIHDGEGDGSLNRVESVQV